MLAKAAAAATRGSTRPMIGFLATRSWTMSQAGACRGGGDGCNACRQARCVRHAVGSSAKPPRGSTLGWRCELQTSGTREGPVLLRDQNEKRFWSR